MRNRKPDELGPILFACRLGSATRPLASSIWGYLASFKWQWLYFIPVFLFCSLLMTLWIAGIIFIMADLLLTVLWKQHCPNDALTLLFPLVFPFAVALTIWIGFFWPRTCCLIAHERGLRGRTLFRGYSVLFSDVEFLRIGAGPGGSNR